jgi:hypothetical protein
MTQHNPKLSFFEPIFPPYPYTLLLRTIPPPCPYTMCHLHCVGRQLRYPSSLYFLPTLSLPTPCYSIKSITLSMSSHIIFLPFLTIPFPPVLFYPIPSIPTIPFPPFLFYYIPRNAPVILFFSLPHCLLSPPSHSLHFFSILIPSISPQPRSLHHPIPSIPHDPVPASPLLPRSLYYSTPCISLLPFPFSPPLSLSHHPSALPAVHISCLPPVNPSRLPHFLFATLLFYPAPFTLQYISNFSLPSLCSTST